MSKRTKSKPNPRPAGGEKVTLRYVGETRATRHDDRVLEQGELHVVPAGEVADHLATGLFKRVQTSAPAPAPLAASDEKGKE